MKAVESASNQRCRCFVITAIERTEICRVSLDFQIERKPYLSLFYRARLSLCVQRVGKTITGIAIEHAASHCKPRAPRAFLRVGGSAALCLLLLMPMPMN